MDKAIENKITHIYIVLDNVPMHTGQQVRAWLAEHPRFSFVHPPVHCSWLNQVEQWFSILQRKRFRVVNFASLEDLAERIEAFIREWNEKAHSFKWTSARGAKLIERYEQKLALAAGTTEVERGTVEVKDHSLQPVISLRQGIEIRQRRGSWHYALVA